MNLLSKLQSGIFNNPLVVIDPFKINLTEAKQKAKFLKDLGINVLILAGTDSHSLEKWIKSYVVEIKKEVDINIIVNFPPSYPNGFISFKDADATIFSHVLNSEEEYFRLKSFNIDQLKSSRAVDENFCNVLTCAGITFGDDAKSRQWVGAVPVDKKELTLIRFMDRIRQNKYDIVYLFSRYETVDLDVCKYIKNNLAENQLLIVSGGFSAKKSIETYLQNGVNYIACCSAFEIPNWKDRMLELLT